MKYETPELTALTPAINAIQGIVSMSRQSTMLTIDNENPGRYPDWE